MTSDETETEQRQALNLLVPHADLTLEQVWARYFALGGISGVLEVEAYLHGLMPLPALQRDVLAHAVNERLGELARADRVPYSWEDRRQTPPVGALAALAELLDGSRLTAPEHLAALAEKAAAAIGVRLVTYLVDYPQRDLVPLPSPASQGRAAVSVEGTLAGRAFQLVQAVASESAEQPRLWVPLVDGMERLGVLDVMVGDQQDLHDEALRAQCRWLSALLGHLVTAFAGYGDALDAVRIPRPRTVAAELLWSMLPPLTTGVGGFLLSGLLEPSDQVGGDAFDYSLSATTVSLAIFDAMGHHLAASLAAAAAVSAYRAARRSGGDVAGQARAIDETLAAHFPDAFCTGVLAELDLGSGRLRYVCAGHPPPLVYREGKVVRSLDGGRRVPFGLARAVGPADAGAGEGVAEETLQPGDWLMLYTDGVTEARDDAGADFGEPRLVDFLAREAAAGHPPPETVRRLIHAVLAHQHGHLQDDATVVLASWDRDAGARAPVPASGPDAG